MTKVVLSNVLTAEERGGLIRLVSHEGGNSMCVLAQGDGRDDSNPAFFAHEQNAFSIWNTLLYMGRWDKISFRAGDSLLKYERNMDESLKNLVSLHSGKMAFSRNTDYEFDSYGHFPPFLFLTLSTLIKNATIYNDSDKPVDLIIEDQHGFPSGAVYVPKHAREHSEFVAFRVHDDGKGFPQPAEEGQMLFESWDFPTPQQEMYTKYFTTCPQRGWHGFGLYFTGLVAKVLQAPIGIKSVPGDTTVSFYHPVDYKQ